MFDKREVVLEGCRGSGKVCKPPWDGQEERQGSVLPTALGVNAAGACHSALLLESRIRCSEPSLQEFKVLLDYFNAEGCSERESCSI